MFARKNQRKNRLRQESNPHLFCQSFKHWSNVWTSNWSILPVRVDSDQVWFPYTTQSFLNLRAPFWHYHPLSSTKAVGGPWILPNADSSTGLYTESCLMMYFRLSTQSCPQGTTINPTQSCKVVGRRLSATVIPHLRRWSLWAFRCYLNQILAPGDLIWISSNAWREQYSTSNFAAIS